MSNKTEPRPLRVLVADDSRLQQTITAGLLAARAFQVTFVNDGEQAVAAAAASGFDLILMDIEMPNMDGLRAAKRIRRLEQGSAARVPIIATTSTKDHDRCYAAGMDGFVPKPLLPEALFAAIDSVLSATTTAATAACETSSD